VGKTDIDFGLRILTEHAREFLVIFWQNSPPVRCACET